MADRSVSDVMSDAAVMGKAVGAETAFRDANSKMRSYVEKYIEALKNARGGIRTQDEQAKAAAKAGEGIEV